MALGHADRVVPLRNYCAGLLLPGDRKSIEPMATRVEPGRVQAAHQSLHHLIAKADWSDAAMLLEMLLPHVQRALDLRERLAAQDTSLRLTVGTLDALPTSLVIVDAGSRVRFANAASRRALSRPGSGLAMLASGPRIQEGGTHLTSPRCTATMHGLCGN